MTKEQADQKFNALMQKYSQVCVQLGELEYHYQSVIPKRRKELLSECDQLQKQANKCKVREDGAPAWDPPEVKPEPDATSAQS